MRNITICCDGTGNEISENISNVLKLYRCLRMTEKTLLQEQQDWPMVERRNLFTICKHCRSPARKKSPPCGRRCPHGSSSRSIVHPPGRGA
jgi:hypothetical protein